MFEVEQLHLLPGGPQKTKEPTRKTFTKYVIASLVVLLLVLAYSKYSKTQKIEISRVEAFAGLQGSIHEIIHYGHFLSRAVPLTKSEPLTRNFVSQFAKEYLSIRKDKLSTKEQETLMVIDDLGTMLEQINTEINQEIRYKVFWERVMPTFAVKPAMISDPSLTNAKTYTHKLAHSNVLQAPLLERIQTESEAVTQSELRSSAQVSALLDDIDNLISTISSEGPSVLKAMSLLERAAGLSKVTLEQVTSSARSLRSAAVATFLSKMSQILSSRAPREAFMFLLAFEVSRLSANLDSESQLLCRVVETIVQNWSMFRHVSREKVNQMLASVFKANFDRKPKTKAELLNQPLINEDESEGAWVSLSLANWQ